MKKAWRDSLERFSFLNTWCMKTVQMILLMDKIQKTTNDDEEIPIIYRVSNVSGPSTVLFWSWHPFCFEISNALSVSRPVDFLLDVYHLGVDQLSRATSPEALKKTVERSLQGPGVRCGFGGGIWSWRHRVGHGNTQKKWCFSNVLLVMFYISRCMYGERIQKYQQVLTFGKLWPLKPNLLEKS